MVVRVPLGPADDSQTRRVWSSEALMRYGAAPLAARQGQHTLFTVDAWPPTTCPRGDAVRSPGASARRTRLAPHSVH